jgi:hypothetical protein
MNQAKRIQQRAMLFISSRAAGQRTASLLHDLMARYGCKPERRDTAGMLQSRDDRWGWLAPNGDWTASDWAKPRAEAGG